MSEVISPIREMWHDCGEKMEFIALLDCPETQARCPKHPNLKKYLCYYKKP
jgi:hypothetical protein